MAPDPPLGTGVGVAVLAALAVTLAMAVPVLQAPSTRLFGTEIVGRHHDPFTVMAHFRQPPPLGWWTQPATDLPGRLLARVAGPVAAHNWLVLASFPLSAATAYLLARHLTGSHLGSMVAALAYAFSPFHLAHAAYHVHIAQIQWLPLYLLTLWGCLDRPRLGRALLLLGATAALVLSGFYGGFIGAVLTPLALLGYWMVAPRQAGPRNARGLAVTVLALGLLAVAGLLYVRAVAPGLLGDPASLAFPRADLFRYSAKWWSYLVPPVEHPLAGTWARGVWERHGIGGALLEQQVAVGWSLLALAAIPVWRWLRGDRDSPGIRTAPLLAALAVAALLCSLSPERRIGSFTLLRPSGYLYALAPVFRAYARFGVAVQLMVALLAGTGVAWLARRRTPTRTVALVLLVGMAVVEYLPAPPWRWRDVLPTRAHRWLASEPGPIRVLDCAPVRQASQQSVLWLLGHPVSLLGGPFADCAEPQLAGKLAAMGYTHLLVRHDRRGSPRLTTAPGHDGLRLVREFPDGSVFRVVAETPSVYTAELRGFEPREPDGARTRRWMAREGTWTVVNGGSGPAPAALAVELTPFPAPRRVEIHLNGRPATALVVPAGRHLCRIEPLTLAPGDNSLLFRAEEPPGARPGSSRPVALAVGDWRWAAAGETPGTRPLGPIGAAACSAIDG